MGSQRQYIHHLLEVYHTSLSKPTTFAPTNVFVLTTTCPSLFTIVLAQFYL